MIKKLAITLPGAILAFSLIALAAPNVRAQEGEAVVVDEVVAQVNDGVITLSQLKLEMKDAIDALVAQGKTREEATAAVEKTRGDMIVALVNEQLLLQKGKELDLATEVEAEVNSRLLAAGKEQGITKLEDLCTAMKSQGVDCDEVRTSLRAEVMKVAVLNREVDGKLFYGWTDAQIQAYYKAHPEKFKRAESVTLSEIFLELAGKSEADVKAKSDLIISQARGGADFVALAKTYSDRREQDGSRTAQKTGGLVGTFEVPSLRPDIATAIKSVKVGGVAEPMVTPEGIQIVHVDARVDAADTPLFNENNIREAMTMEAIPDARKAYLEKLRKDAFVKIAEGYRPLVGGQFDDSTVATSVSSGDSTDQKSSKKEKKGIMSKLTHWKGGKKKD